MADNNVNAQISSEEYKKVTEELYKQNLEVVKLYKKVEELNQELELANEGQAQLIHFINHQIKGYLGKARNIFSELLTEPGYGACTDEARPMLNEGFKDVTEGVDFVQQILRASDIEKGTFTYDMKPLDMKEIVKSEAEGKRELAEGKGLKYEINIKDGDYRTRGDTGQLKEAIKNLIDNSINYTSKGTINLQLTTDNKKILFIVKDTGMGLSNEIKSRLFTKGGRDKDSLKVNINSTGFGLSIVKGIVGAHKGRVWADSLGPGQGSTFYLELPVV